VNFQQNPYNTFHHYRHELGVLLFWDTVYYDNVTLSAVNFLLPFKAKTKVSVVKAKTFKRSYSHSRN